MFYCRALDRKAATVAAADHSSSFLVLSPSGLYKYVFMNTCAYVLSKHAKTLGKEKLLLSSMKIGGEKQYHMSSRSTAAGCWA